MPPPLRGDFALGETVRRGGSVGVAASRRSGGERGGARLKSCSAVEARTTSERVGGLLPRPGVEADRLGFLRPARIWLPHAPVVSDATGWRGVDGGAKVPGWQTPSIVAGWRAINTRDRKRLLKFVRRPSSTIPPRPTQPRASHTYSRAMQLQVSLYQRPGAPSMTFTFSSTSFG